MHQRILEQGSRVRSHGAVTGWASLAWQGARYFSGKDADGQDLPVPLVVGFGKLRNDPRVSISQAQLATTEYRWIGTIRCTTVQRAIFDEMRFASGVRAAVVALEKVIAARMITTSLMRKYVLCRPAWTGVEQVREALSLAVDDSWSPQETSMRLVWRLDAGLPPPLCNTPVFNLAGGFVGVPDLLDVESGTYGEYDGESHAPSERRRADLARAQRFRDVGLESFVVVGGELTERERVAQRMLATRGRAMRSAPPRLWTTTPPDWWICEEDLEHYLVRTGQAAYLVRT